MAAITSNAPVLASPAGYENVDFGYASEAIAAGDLVVITNAAAPSSRWDKVYAKATGTTAHGIAIKAVGAGGTCEVAYRGEIDGFSGLTPGAPLSIVDGELDTTAPTGQVFARAVTPTRIRVDMV